MAEALPDESGETQEVVARPPPFERKEAPVTQWAEPAKYDYEALNAGTTGEWDGNARVYEFDEDEGDVGPEHEELEVMLFGKREDRDPSGIDFSKIAQIDVLQEGLTRIEPIRTFDTAGLHPVMLKNVELCGYKTPTPIQKYCIPAIKMGHDIIAIAQTGSGKTAAYLIPILNYLMGKAKKLAAHRPNPADVKVNAYTPVRAEPLVVIVCPARELAIQIFNEARKFCYRTMLRPCVVYGGGPMRDQINNLQRGCDVLIASPGRLIDMMERPDILTLRRVKYMVIDEADEMLHADWEEEFNKILSGGEQEEGNIKYMLFSATFPVAVRKLAKTHLAESHVRIRVGRIGSTHQNIKQDIVWVDPHMKKRALLDLLWSVEQPGRTIIFTNYKRMCDELDDYLFHNDMPCTSMHADRTQREREDSMRAFRSGKTPLLITTGVSARGIDVRNVKHVINYNLPSIDHGGIEEYTHRIAGRTGRIGHKGLATSFYSESDEPLGPLLTLTLLETKQEIPDFLEQYRPEGEAAEKLKFEPDSDEYEEEVVNGGDTGGGADDWGNTDSKPAETGGDGWGGGNNASW
ncbi:P-loop containing nucleoside triphosphate hydrolase protein [Pseudomassariella vexata]|uniref:RNA helicase n=1 Tax=Pseudomassariella vexata TaxID=1141098 RepID=A0A1Y2E7R4_9PEZI|nr:P-loop containing nucleoside triphosphate hydrolase protein [Pseudomassariella vexata]ORY67364.1 P-loop containing nucleoside triphosphate hydrolase protein [Pseudomassariella vexata]